MFTWNPFIGGKLHRYLCSLGIPSLLRKEALLDGFFGVSFVVDTERCSDAWLLFAYLNPPPPIILTNIFMACTVPCCHILSVVLLEVIIVIPFAYNLLGSEEPS